jgi:hypothetical protein
MPEACSPKETRSGFRTIYNSDNRIPVFGNNANLSVYSSQVAMLSHQHSVQSSSPSEVSFKQRRLGDVLQLCSNEAFREQWMLGDCTGFSLDGKNLLTARHCIPDEASCNSRLFVFGRANPSEFSFSNAQLRSCKRIVAALEKEEGDLVFVELDKPLENFSGILRPASDQAIDVANTNTAPNGLFTIGHPFGIAQTAAPIETAFQPINNFFMNARADVAQGMSGAPVIELQKSLVHGLLVGGEVDLEWNEAESCNRSKNCSGDNCSGERFANPAAIQKLLSSVF